MLKIIGALIVSVIGIVMLGNGLQMKYYEHSRPMLILIGGAAQVGSFILMLYGLREFFLGELLTELRMLNGLKPGEIRSNE